MRRQTESLSTLTLDRVTQRGGTRQPFRYYQPKSGLGTEIDCAVVEIKNPAANHPPGRHDGRKLLRPMQALPGSE